MLRLLLLCVLTALLTGCSSLEAEPAADARDANWLRGQLTELEGLHCPDGCEPADWADLKSQLAVTIQQRLDGKAASAPPTAPLAKPLAQLDPSGPFLAWYFVNPGAYAKRRGNVSDLPAVREPCARSWPGSLATSARRHRR